MTPILYLHGFASGPGSQKARYVSAHLQTLGMDVVVPDLAEGDFEHLTISGQLAVVERVAAGRDVSIIGSSMGGYLAALYAVRHEEVSRLVLLAPAFDFARRWAESHSAEEMAEWRSTGEIEVFHYADKQNRKLNYGLMEDAAKFEPFPDFKQRALIFHGAHDDVVPPTVSAEFVATHPNATIEIVDSGHELLNVLDYISQRIGEFLSVAPAA